MLYASCFSGIEAASVAWKPLGWKAAWFSENDPFACAVLQHRFPDTLNLGDITRIHETIEFQKHQPDIIVGGSPCQAFSTAGLKKGLQDPRGNLTLVFLSIIDRLRPRWIVWENVVGVLSTRNAEGFLSFVKGLDAIGYHIAWRVLDSQYFGVAQRRRRVFVVANSGDGIAPQKVLFDGEKRQRDFESYIQSWQKEAGIVNICAQGKNENSPSGVSDNQTDSPVYYNKQSSLMASPGNPELVVTIATGQANAETIKELSPTLTCSHDPVMVAYGLNIRGRKGGAVPEIVREKSMTLRTSRRGGDKQHVIQELIIRKLTPLEYERLMGFLPGWTAIPFKGKINAADTHRYRALGNSMAVPVMHWIGLGIKEQEA